MREFCCYKSIDDRNEIVCSNCVGILKHNSSKYLKYVPACSQWSDACRSYFSLKMVRCALCENSMYDIFNEVTGFALYSNIKLNRDYCHKCYNKNTFCEYEKITCVKQRFPKGNYGMSDMYDIIKCKKCNKTIAEVLATHIEFMQMVPESSQSNVHHFIIKMIYPSGCNIS
jgi:hypothetical protein